jgi:hypothetical protein
MRPVCVCVCVCVWDAQRVCVLTLKVCLCTLLCVCVCVCMCVCAGWGGFQKSLCVRHIALLRSSASESTQRVRLLAHTANLCIYAVCPALQEHTRGLGVKPSKSAICLLCVMCMWLHFGASSSR